MANMQYACHRRDTGTLRIALQLSIIDYTKKLFMSENTIYFTRKLKPTESKIYRKIRLESQRENPESFEAKYQEQVQVPKLYFERILKENSPRGIMVGTFLKNELIGICGVTFETNTINNAGEIIQMYVKEKHRGNKIGLELLTRLQCEVKELQNIKMLVLSVKKNNLPAIKTYNYFGFEINETIPTENNAQYMSLSV